MSEPETVAPPPQQTAQPLPAKESTPLLHNPPQGGPAMTTVVLQQPTQSGPPKFRDIPVDMVDEKGNQYTTELRYVNGLLTWLAVGITCLIAGSFGLPCIGLIPLCVKSFKDVEHVNPMDGSVVGKYDRGADLGLK